MPHPKKTNAAKPVSISDVESAKKAGIDAAHELIGTVAENHLHAALYAFRMHVQQHLDVRTKEAEDILMNSKSSQDALHTAIPK